MIRAAQIVAVAFAAGQIQAHADARAHDDVLDLQAAQLVAAKAAPETQQDQCRITPAAQQSAHVAGRSGRGALLAQSLDHLLQMAQLQGLGLLLPGRMQRTNALQRLAYHRRLGRVGKALAVVPLGQRGQPQLQGVQRQLAGVAGQVAGDAVAGRRQEAAPLHLEMFDGRAIAAAGVVAGGGLQVAVEIGHARFQGRFVRVATQLGVPAAFQAG
ncbi:hypothetical protein D3C80_1322860 [compost metagenome]